MLSPAQFAHINKQVSADGPPTPAVSAEMDRIRGEQREPDPLSLRNEVRDLGLRVAQ